MHPISTSSAQVVGPDPAQLAQAAARDRLRSAARAARARALTHDERITISDEARWASRDARPPPIGDVKSYRAYRYGSRAPETALAGGTAPPPPGARACLRYTRR